MKKNLITLAAIVICLSLAGGLANLASPNTNELLGLSVFIWCIAFSFIFNWLAYIPAILAQTEHYYDLTGSLTYLILIVFATLYSEDLDFRAYLVAIISVIWALRLGLFLFIRVKKRGGDDRFDIIKTQPLRFFMAWTIQALWVSLTLACTLIIIVNQTRVPFSWFGVIGCILWFFGFVIEVLADFQKSSFNQNPKNNGKFISTGLWSWSQHPNYFGEILLWTGIALIAIPVLSSGQWVCLVSPLFVFTLIRFVSGVRLLDEKAQKKWGNDIEYSKYQQRTSLLILLPPKQKI